MLAYTLSNLVLNIYSVDFSWYENENSPWILSYEWRLHEYLAVLGHKWLCNKRLQVLASSSIISPLNSFRTPRWMPYGLVIYLYLICQSGSWALTAVSTLTSLLSIEEGKLGRTFILEDTSCARSITNWSHDSPSHCLPLVAQNNICDWPGIGIPQLYFWLKFLGCCSVLMCLFFCHGLSEIPCHAGMLSSWRACYFGLWLHSRHLSWNSNTVF